MNTESENRSVADSIPALGTMAPLPNIFGFLSFA
jgi:hypothetical protein